MIRRVGSTGAMTVHGMARMLVALTLVIAGIVMAGSVQAQTGTRHAILIGGLGGSPEYTATYRGYLLDTRTALIDRFRFAPENIVVLAEEATAVEDFVDNVSNAENIAAALKDIAEKVNAIDEVYIVLYGHGSSDGEHSVLNIPRQDLTDTEYAEMIDDIGAGTIVFVNTASSSGPFVTRLAGPNRIVIAATRSATERNETVFPMLFVEALTSEASDSDKNGDLSVLEVFRYASERTALYFEDGGHLATEHPIMDDTGDGRGYQADDLAEYGEGERAGMAYFIDHTRITAAAIADTGDPALADLFVRQLTVTQDITALKASKAEFPEDDYYAMLEPLLIRLATIADEIEARQESLPATQ